MLKYLTIMILIVASIALFIVLIYSKEEILPIQEVVLLENVEEIRFCIAGIGDYILPEEEMKKFIDDLHAMKSIKKIHDYGDDFEEPVGWTYIIEVYSEIALQRINVFADDSIDGDFRIGNEVYKFIEDNFLYESVKKVHDLFF